MKQTDIDAIKYRLIQRGFDKDNILNNGGLIEATIDEARKIYYKTDIVFSIENICNALKKGNNGRSTTNI